MRRFNDCSPGRVVAGLLVLASTPGCGGAGPVPSPFRSAPAAEALEYERYPDEISRGEIVDRGDNDHTAMALIRRLRPGWLLARGENSFTDPSAKYPIVYIDEIRHGGLMTLHHIPSSEILRLEYYGMADATTRWGTGHTAGVINVVTGRF